MSRICVKNLPKDVAEDELREFFSGKGGIITDAKLMRTKDGKSRQFAFIGYRTEDEAQEAIRYFNKNFLRTSRIICEVARKHGDENLPRPWSRHSKKKDDKVTAPDVEKPARANKGQGENSKGSVGDDVDDPQLQDFLQVMQPRVKSKMWANDTSIATNVDNRQAMPNKDNDGASVASDQSGSLEDGFLEDSEPKNKSHEPERDKVISDMDYFKSRVTTEWSDSESSDGEDDDDDNDSSCIDSDRDDHSNAGKDEDNCDSRNGAREVDVDLEGKEDTSGENVTNGKTQVNVTEQGGQLSKSEDEKGVFDSCRLFVRNLPYTTTEEELEEHFSRFGSVSQVHLVVNKDTKRSKGIAYILYTAPNIAARAQEELDNSIFQGRLLHVMPALQRHSDNQENNVLKDQSSKTLKQQRQEKRKADEASGDTRAWNSLFMRSDTVVENIARKFGVSKSDLLDREADDLAVRIALGETQVISETKKAFKNAGVNVEALEELANNKTDELKRSNHVLLVKNLPYGSTENELAKMFGKFGSLDKIILPPTKTLALVVFLEPVEARAAFRGLAYKRFNCALVTCWSWVRIRKQPLCICKDKTAYNIPPSYLRIAKSLWAMGDAPLYLEWAPSNILSQSSTSKNNEINGAIGENEAKRQILEQQVERITDVDIDSDRVQARSLFVKNLNFKTIDESLRKHLTEHMKEGSILSVKVKKHLKNGKNVSMGFGFVEFDSPETATNVCKDLQGTVLDSHALILQPCNVKNDGQKQKTLEKDRSSTKLLIKNVAFEATEKDLRRLFSPFGQVLSEYRYSSDNKGTGIEVASHVNMGKIKSLRLPMKFGNHRGFAFVEYVTQQEAQNALKALSSTHLYGRHLVIERAKEAESLEELRARTAAQFSDEQNGFQSAMKFSKKRKQVDFLDEGKMKFGRMAD
ncbi:Multiple RNA-binding domain-containing protein 1 [Glycine max]|nr:Multiple RNA-binding domain-containing protein 1 [Glycine max]